MKNTHLVLLDPENGKQTPLMSFSEDGYALHLDWSPDGGSLYYDGCDGSRNPTNTVEHSPLS